MERFDFCPVSNIRSETEILHIICYVRISNFFVIRVRKQINGIIFSQYSDPEQIGRTFF